MEKAEGYSKLFDSWTDITSKNGIAAAAAHSRIKDLDRGVLLIETDHPGWKQILQTKQSKLLSDFRRRFPRLDISGISLMLGKSASLPDLAADTAENPAANPPEPAAVFEPFPESSVLPAAKGFDAIDDEDFKETLKKLGQTIAKKGKR